MAVNVSRSLNSSLDKGSTDGKYRKVRPDTEVVDTAGDSKVRAERVSLHPYFNYGQITTEATSQVNSGR